MSIHKLLINDGNFPFYYNISFLINYRVVTINSVISTTVATGSSRLYTKTIDL